MDFSGCTDINLFLLMFIFTRLDACLELPPLPKIHGFSAPVWLLPATAARENVVWLRVFFSHVLVVRL